MANPLWVPGSKSANPNGRPRHSVRTVKGMVERFIKRNITPNKLQVMYDGLTVQQKLDMLTELLPYVAPRQSADGLTPSQIDEAYERLVKAMEAKEKHGKTA
jgi:hypothetical protein